MQRYWEEDGSNNMVGGITMQLSRGSSWISSLVAIVIVVEWIMLILNVLVVCVVENIVLRI